MFPQNKGNNSYTQYCLIHSYQNILVLFSIPIPPLENDLFTVEDKGY